jgi:Replication protein
VTKTAAQRRPLGNRANKVSPCSPADRLRAREERRRRRRRERHVLRGGLRDLTNLERVRKCGHVTVGAPGGGPGLRLTTSPAGPVAGLSGLLTCGSVWSCPVCAAKIATRRADELADVMRFALEQNCRASLVSLTMRHHAGQRLKDCWDALSTAWRAVVSGKQWATDAFLFQIRGWVKAVEVTRGRNGWHVHIHALIIWDRPVTLEQARHVADRMWRRWNRALVRKGFDSLRDDGGLDVRMATLVPGGFGLHEYFVKLSHEITGGQAKLAKGGGRTPFQIAASATETGEAADVHAWWEWEKASHGRRQIGWSKGLRAWAGLDAEQDDDEVAAEQLEGDDLLFLDLDSWRAIRGEPGRVCDLLEVTEDDGYRAAMATLRRWGLGYMLVNRHRVGIP